MPAFICPASYPVPGVARALTCDLRVSTWTDMPKSISLQPPDSVIITFSRVASLVAATVSHGQHCHGHTTARSSQLLMRSVACLPPACRCVPAHPCVRSLRNAPVSQAQGLELEHAVHDVEHHVVHHHLRQSATG